MKRRITSIFEWRYYGHRNGLEPITNLTVRCNKDGRSVTYSDQTFGLELRISSIPGADWRTVLRFFPVEHHPEDSLFDISDIIERLKLLETQGVLVYGARRYPDCFVGVSRGNLWFDQWSLKRKTGEQFGDAALRTALAIYEAFGVKDMKQCASRFTHKQGTEVEYDGKWMSYENYLRTKFELPPQST